jgi:hypothetical protein
MYHPRQLNKHAEWDWGYIIVTAMPYRVMYSAVRVLHSSAFICMCVCLCVFTERVWGHEAALSMGYHGHYINWNLCDTPKLEMHATWEPLPVCTSTTQLTSKAQNGNQSCSWGRCNVNTDRQQSPASTLLYWEPKLYFLSDHPLPYLTTITS